MADYYGTVAGFRAYHLARGNTADVGTYSDSKVLKGLLSTSEWLDFRYRRFLMGLKVGGREQVRDWPRTGVYDVHGDSVSSESVPVEVEYATYEALLKDLADPGTLIKDYVPSKYQRVSIDGSLSVTYAERSASEVQKEFPVIDQVLDGLIDFNATYNPVSTRASRR